MHSSSEQRVAIRETSRLDFEPGTRGVDACIQIPPEAGTGAYTFSVTGTAGSLVFKETLSFQVIRTYRVFRHAAAQKQKSPQAGT